MSTSAKLTNAPDALAFLLSGNATFTIVSLKTGTRFTYRVRKPEDGGVHFISVLNGPARDASTMYLGIINNRGEVYVTRNSRFGLNDPQVTAFKWLLKNLQTGHLYGVEFWHEGRCGRCARPLTDPASIARGIGPDCAKLMCETVADKKLEAKFAKWDA